MVVSEITLFNILKAKLGEHEAQTVVEGIKEELGNIKDMLATKTDVEKIKAELLVVKWMLGVVLAGILSLVLKAFFHL